MCSATSHMDCSHSASLITVSEGYLGALPLFGTCVCVDPEGSPLMIQPHTFSRTLQTLPTITLVTSPQKKKQVREDGQSLLATSTHPPCLPELMSCPFPPDLLQEALPVGKLTQQRICSKLRAPLTLKCSSWSLVLSTSSSHSWCRDSNLSQYTDLSSCL